MNTGEDTQGLRKIIDFTRLINIFILSIHFYLCSYLTFKQWGVTVEISDPIITKIAKTGLFNIMTNSKLAALLFLFILLINVKVEIDRTKRDVRYKSGKFYYLLANQTMSDSIEFPIEIVAKK